MATEKPPSVRETLPRALRVHRAGTGLTQAEVAEGSGVSERRISEFERGQWGLHGPGIFTLEKLAHFYGVGLGDLFLPADDLYFGAVSQGT